jgi:hypothetical protein
MDYKGLNKGCYYPCNLLLHYSLQGPGKLYQTLRSIDQESQRNPITAVFLQDHRITATAKHRRRIEGIAKMFRLLVVTGYAPSRANGQGYGGTMVVVPYAAIKTPKGNLHEEVRQVAATRRSALQGRYVSVLLKVEGVERRLASVYAPAKAIATDPMSKKSYFFTRLKPLLTRSTIMGIDANCVPDPRLDLKRDAATPYPNEGANELREAVDEKGLEDITRKTLGDAGDFFWTAHHITSAGACWTRIDQIYAPADGLTQWDHTPCRDFFPERDTVEIDHKALEARSKLIKNKRGTDLETISEKVFDNGPFVRQLHAFVHGKLETHRAQLEGAGGWRAFWEETKLEIKDMCVTATKRLKYQESVNLTRMKTVLNMSQRNIDRGNATADDIRQHKEKEKAVRDLRKEEYTLHQTLEKEAYNMGKGHDRCTAEFFRPWKDTHAAQHIEEMMKADWTNPSSPVLTQPLQHARGDKAVLAEQTKYYLALFAKEIIGQAAVDTCLDTLRDPNSRRVLPPTAAACDAPITPEEVESVINDLPTGKSSGPDRIPNKMYRVLTKDLTEIITNVLNESQREGALPDSCLQGIISTMHKKQARDDPRNYRPITLLNGDYKIFTRALTRRMNKAVLQIVSPQQNGFVPGGFLPENIMLLKLIQAYIEDEDSDAYFVFLDMEKAFDRCSWEYLHRALDAIGFNGSDPSTGNAQKGFIDYIKLFYSHDNPPTRQLSMNGHLGPRFPLHSGVAQGCPISPLLFLVVTEALTRMLVNDPTAGGVEINGVMHVISQYADDSTLIGRNQGHWLRQSHHKDVWCEATAMAENAAKREGQLLGKLNRERGRAPTGIIKDEAWVKDGDSIRALGVPMGNKLDLLEWWRKRYRVVKERVAAWRSISHMSITGRNLLLQAILYGSLRFWLFSITIPKQISKMIEEDAYHLIWASNPELFTDEEGTKARSRAYVYAEASYLPQKGGGAGLTHWRSHVRAFYAQWGKRYLHPSEPPWKSVADVWLATPYPMKRGTLLTDMQDSLYTSIPVTAPYLRECIRQFEALELRQETVTRTAHIAGESIFQNNRFTIDIPDDAVAAWSKYIKLTRIYNLIDRDTKQMFTDADMKEFTETRAPEQIRDTPRMWEWSEELMKTWPAIRDGVPPDLIAAAAIDPADPAPKEGMYYAFAPDMGTDLRYARCEPDPHSNHFRYQYQ